MIFYKKYNWAPLFFIIFMIINYLLLLNMVLGLFYAIYRKELESQTREFFIEKENLIKKYLSKYLRV
jgi:hypothetical protein